MESRAPRWRCRDPVLCCRRAAFGALCRPLLWLLTVTCFLHRLQSVSPVGGASGTLPLPPSCGPCWGHPAFSTLNREDKPDPLPGLLRGLLLQARAHGLQGAGGPCDLRQSPPDHPHRCPSRMVGRGSGWREGGSQYQVQPAPGHSGPCLDPRLARSVPLSGVLPSSC